MKLVWVNHASFIVDLGAIRLITDPWLEGTAFHNGWRLMADSRMRYEDFAGITHIWFSHEHPDHFSPPNLRRIPEEYRRRITVLFQERRDRRVLDLCESLGFRVQELPLNRPVELAPDVSMLCGPQGLLDSWMALTSAGETLLNMNDCVFDEPWELAEVKRRVGKVDLLLTQFSFAAWIGNEGDVESHRRHASEKLAEMRRQIELFSPRCLIPFASYIYFSHRENFYMNQAANRIEDVYRFTREQLGCETVVLYPGECWETGTDHDSLASIRCYDASLRAALSKPPDQPRKVSLEELERAAAALVQKNRRRNNSILLSLLPAMVVHLTDLNLDVEFSYRRGLRQVSGRKPVMALSADALCYCLEYDWGGNTLEINGRYQVLPGRDAEWFFRLLRVSQHNASGECLEELAFHKIAHWFAGLFRYPRLHAERT